MAGLGDDAGVVAAAGEEIGDLGVGEQMNLMGRPPRRDVIPLRADSENGDANVMQRDRAAVRVKAPFGEIIV